MITEEPADRAVRADGVRRRIRRDEVLLVLAASLGASAVSALISFVGSVTREGGLAHQPAELNRSAAPGRPWLDLAWQLFGIASALVPVFLVAHFLTRGGESLRDLGVDGRHRWLDLGRGAAVAAVIGGSGLALYLGAHAAGANLTVVPTSLPDVWWRIPVLVLSAIENAALEEVVVLGYLVHRLTQMGWSFRRVLVASSVLRGSYHLYQGIGGFVGNLVMGVIFCVLYRRWGRVMPLLVAHALIDIVAFVGYVLLAGKVSWLPTG
ncbi:CPBP family intramembrane metalloprotease [Yinghuangia sp. ASG 101]|uniref:CPBP family intramembrane glutamic endopeptidase n=1 Tax=Yinghuangia sp. ASG 101 TaxID=2896848 RepID=UPI001E63B562|nr:type II CAAX endopeptidase family protein [Yinghuangia sp. ASG 101]UGQ10778.1 CPBP family intramembrane metalloprotease [Yinghuangia sp. ASG 101]